MFSKPYLQFSQAIALRERRAIRILERQAAPSTSLAAIQSYYTRSMTLEPAIYSPSTAVRANSRTHRPIREAPACLLQQ
jgi:hypothetical protein